MVTKLDSPAHSVADIVGIVQKFEAKQVNLVVIDLMIDMTTMYGSLD